MKNEKKIIQRWVTFFLVTLALSGLTALPVETELNFLCKVFPPGTLIGNWLDTVFIGFYSTNKAYPFLAYGYDWLAFAHFVLAILFVGPLRDPVRNKWVIEFGIIACVLIIPFAIIAGYYRTIPLWWRVVDASFGIVGIILLQFVLKKINALESMQSKQFTS